MDFRNRYSGDLLAGLEIVGCVFTLIGGAIVAAAFAIGAWLF